MVNGIINLFIYSFFSPMVNHKKHYAVDYKKKGIQHAMQNIHICIYIYIYIEERYFMFNYGNTTTPHRKRPAIILHKII